MFTVYKFTYYEVAAWHWLAELYYVLYYVLNLLCAELQREIHYQDRELCGVRQLWELQKLGIKYWEYPFFKVVCVWNYWMIQMVPLHFSA